MYSFDLLHKSFIELLKGSDAIVTQPMTGRRAPPDNALPALLPSFFKAFVRLFSGISPTHRVAVRARRIMDRHRRLGPAPPVPRQDAGRQPTPRLDLLLIII